MWLVLSRGANAAAIEDPQGERSGFCVCAGDCDGRDRGWCSWPRDELIPSVYWLRSTPSVLFKAKAREAQGG